MLALSTNCTVTVTFRPSEHILCHNVLRYVTTDLCHLLLYLELGLSLIGGVLNPCYLAFSPVVVVTVRMQNQDESGDMLSSLLPSLSWELSKQLIKFVAKLLLGRERKSQLSNCFKCLQSLQTVSASLTLIRTLPKEQ